MSELDDTIPLLPETPSTTETPKQMPSTLDHLPPLEDSPKQDDLEENPFPRADTEKKFIPLLNFEDKPESSSTKSSVDFWVDPSTMMVTHIQKIPRRGRTRLSEKAESRAIVFPWAYGDDKSNSETKYIPLNAAPEERVSDMPFVEKTR